MPWPGEASSCLGKATPSSNCPARSTAQCTSNHERAPLHVLASMAASAPPAPAVVVIDEDVKKRTLGVVPLRQCTWARLFFRNRTPSPRTTCRVQGPEAEAQTQIRACLVTARCHLSLHSRQPSLARQLVLKLDEGETLKVTVEKVGKASATADEFQSDLSSSECRYAVYDHEGAAPAPRAHVLCLPTHCCLHLPATDTLPDGRKKSKLLFILWAHSRARPSSCMTYTSRKNAVSSALEGVFDVTARNEDELLELLGLKVDDEDSEEWDPDA